MGMGELIRCENIAFRYEASSRFAIEDLNFSINEGDFLAILGENGSGKTTILKLIAGLLTPTQGQISFSGLYPSEIGYLPQNTAVRKDFPATVFEVAASGLLARKNFPPFYTKTDKREVKACLERLRAEDLAEKSFSALSGGQRQRVLLSRALLASAKILLLDEPSAGLDPAATADLYALLTDLNKDGMTLVMVSHDIDAAKKVANNVLYMKDGKGEASYV